MLFFCSKFLVLCHVTTFCYNITVEVMGETYETITTHYYYYYDATVKLRQLYAVDT